MDFQPMSPDEMQRTMQFLLGQQAKFSGDFDRLSEKVESLAGTTERLAGTTERIADSMIGLTGIVGRLATSVDGLRDAFARHLREDHGYEA